jgi:hypothetical protein
MPKAAKLLLACAMCLGFAALLFWLFDSGL